VPVRLREAGGPSASQKGVTLAAVNDTEKTAAALEVSIICCNYRFPGPFRIIEGAINVKMLTQVGFNITHLSAYPVPQGHPPFGCTPGRPCIIPPGPVDRFVRFPFELTGDPTVYIEIRGYDSNGNIDYFYHYACGGQDLQCVIH